MNKEKNYAIHFTLFKILGVYQMVDPSSRKIIFGLNVYHLVNITLITFTLIMTIFGVSGFFFKIRDSYENNIFDLVMVVFYNICMTTGTYKTYMIMANAHKIWSSFDVSHELFLSNRHYNRHFYKVVKCGDQISKLFNWYFYLLILTLIAYAMIPFFYNTHIEGNRTQHEETIRKTNIFQLNYPVSAATYNDFFVVFYVSECIMTFYTGYTTLTFDLIALTTLMIISVQYEIIGISLESLGKPVDNEEGNLLSVEDLQENILSLIWDCQKMFKQLQIVYDITRPVGLLLMPVDASVMVLMPFLIMKSYQENESLINITTITFVLTLIIAGVQCFMYCLLFQRITDNKESLNLSLYCCDWTAMDIKIKKLILLKMRLNNSTFSLKMNVTPSTCVDLPMFSYIIRTTYRILSVVVNASNAHSGV